MMIYCSTGCTRAVVRFHSQESNPTAVSTILRIAYTASHANSILCTKFCTAFKQDTQKVTCGANIGSFCFFGPIIHFSIWYCTV